MLEFNFLKSILCFIFFFNIIFGMCQNYQFMIQVHRVNVEKFLFYLRDNLDRLKTIYKQKSPKFVHHLLITFKALFLYKNP